jgi:lipoate-protein ligase B
MPRELTVYQLGVVGYDEALAAQRALVDRLGRSQADAGELILLEHPPILTVGRSGTSANILVPAQALAAAGVTVRETNRGGDVTYHGPGQIVGYPILPLVHHGKDVHAYLRRLEGVLMATLGEFGVASERREGYTGVWTARGKIASIGVAITRWVSWHGFALNVSPNLEHFKLIHPCGLVGARIASMQSILGAAPSRAAVEEVLLRRFCAEFGFDGMTLLRHLPESGVEG